MPNRRRARRSPALLLAAVVASIVALVAQKGLRELMIGSTGGSLGETAGVLILACGLYLAWKRYLDWRIPLSIMLTVAG